MATAKVPTSSGNPLEGIAAIMQTLGGTRTSSNPGDISALQQVLGQLQGADYSKLLEGIFQQAAGNIPGLQRSMSNAVGARSGNNSAMAAALQELLKQTALEGQKQIAAQQLQNQQTQAQAAAAIAQATKGTSSKSGTDLGGAAKGLAMLQLLGKAGSFFDEQAKTDGPLGGVGKFFGLGGAAASTPALPAAVAAPAGDLKDFALDLAAPEQGMAPMDWTGGRELLPGFDNFSDMFASEANALAEATGQDPLDALMDVTGGFGTVPTDEFIDLGQFL